MLPVGEVLLLTSKKYLTEPRDRDRERILDRMMPQLSVKKQAGVSKVKKRRADFLARGHSWPFQVALRRLGPVLTSIGEI